MRMHAHVSDRKGNTRRWDTLSLDNATWTRYTDCGDCAVRWYTLVLDSADMAFRSLVKGDVPINILIHVACVLIIDTSLVRS